jgi:hypothetical protein
VNKKGLEGFSFKAFRNYPHNVMVAQAAPGPTAGG